MRSLQYRTGILIMCFSLLSVSSKAGGSAPEFTKPVAQDLLSRYVSAARAGDSTAVRKVWSKVSVEQAGFWESMHIVVGDMGPFPRLREFVSDYESRVTSVRPDADHYIVEFDWLLRDTSTDRSLGQQISMRHYVVYEDNEFLFVNPLHALTREWQSHRGQRFHFHYPPTIADGGNLMAMDEMESRSREILDLFGDDIDEEIDIYVTPDGAECGELLLHPPAAGYACPPRNVIASTTFVIPHELVHILSAYRGLDIFVNAAFAEGIAVGLGGTATSTAAFSLIQAANIADSNLYVPLDDLVGSTIAEFMANAQVTYHEAGAFLKYLIDKFGLEKLDELYDGVGSAPEFVERIPTVYGGSMRELERQWLIYLDELDLPKLGQHIPKSADVVFAQSDATGDDNGGGELVYPFDERFPRGCFDLTRFEVLKDDDRVYFRLGFRELGRTVVDEASGRTYSPSALIAMRRGDSFDRHVQGNCEGVSFRADPGWDLRLDVGVAVIVRDSYNRTIFATGDIRDSISNWDRNTLEFSLPVDVTGTPDETWGFFVSTALMHDHGLGFLRSFPQPVTRRGSRFSFGGGRLESNPPHIDILLPSSIDQALVLGGRGPQYERAIVVPMLRAER